MHLDSLLFLALCFHLLSQSSLFFKRLSILNTLFISFTSCSTHIFCAFFLLDFALLHPPFSVYCFAPIISVSSHSASLSLSPLSPLLFLCSICRPRVSLSSVLFYSLCFPCLLFSPYASAKHTLIISLSSVPLIVFFPVISFIPLFCCCRKLVIISFAVFDAQWHFFLMLFFFSVAVFLVPQTLSWFLFLNLFLSEFFHILKPFCTCLSAKMQLLYSEFAALWEVQDFTGNFVISGSSILTTKRVIWAEIDKCDSYSSFCYR